MNEAISEEDLLRIFLKKQKKKNRNQRFFTFLYHFLIYLVLIVIGYTGINYQAIAANFGYWWKTDYSSQTSSGAPTVLPTDPSAPTVISQKRSVLDMSDNSVAIPVIDVKAPITFKVNNTAKEVAAGLENGTIQINGTALPGQIGNMYITGHSSNYIWAKGDYNSVFALLDKLVVGDMVYVKYNSIVYEYKVTDQKIVSPKDVSVLKSSGQSVLTLVTCWPVGTSLKRVVVTANQVYPDPSSNTPGEIPPSFQELVSGR